MKDIINNGSSLAVLAVIYVIALIVVRIGCKNESVNKELGTSICSWKTCEKFIVSQTRGQNYLLNRDHNEEKIPSNSPLISAWALLHIFMYAVIGYLVPYQLPIVLSISVLFEVIEHIGYDAHDILDVLWNTIGLWMGGVMRQIFV